MEKIKLEKLGISSQQIEEKIRNIVKGFKIDSEEALPIWIELIPLLKLTKYIDIDDKLKKLIRETLLAMNTEMNSILVRFIGVAEDDKD